ncbi:MAG: methionyl-tRNA formyltransferase [candidate division Zixibacteria bacterium]|nr:methionyl-tRNA formyltransferase [candidate division Zixibacteria bacterium]
MNVVYMGTPEFACFPLTTLIGSHHKVLSVVTGPDKPAGRGHKTIPGPVKTLALEYDLPVYQPQSLKDDAFIQSMASLGADLFVVIAFRILPENLYRLPRCGAINIHASLLPKYRGAAPIHHALKNGETTTGLTSFFLTRRVDEGAMIAQTSTPIDPDENYSSLSGRLSRMAGPFLLETLEKIAEPGFEPSRQNDSLATPAPKIHPEDGLIDWRMERRRIHDHIRAFSERPGAFSFLGDLQVKILQSTLAAESSPAHLEPGRLAAKGRRLFVGAGDGPLGLLRVQPEGKRVMDGAAFINGYRITNQQIFTDARKEVRH